MSKLLVKQYVINSFCVIIQVWAAGNEWTVSIYNTLSLQNYDIKGEITQKFYKLKFYLECVIIIHEENKYWEFVLSRYYPFWILYILFVYYSKQSYGIYSKPFLL